MAGTNQIKLSGRLGKYLRWPLILSIILVVMNIILYFFDLKAGLLVSAFIVVYVLLVLLIYYRNHQMLLGALIDFATQYGQVQSTILKEFEVPYAIMDTEGRVIWSNLEFAALTGKERKKYRFITTMFPEITTEKMPLIQEETELHLTHEDRHFRAHMKSVLIDEWVNTSDIITLTDTGNYLVALFLFDETALTQSIQKYKDETMVPGLLYLDNYDEALESVDAVKRSLLIALIDRKIAKYFEGQDALVRKLEKDKYFIAMRKKTLRWMQEDRFSLLEDVKTVNIGNTMAVTLSVGIGANAGSYEKNAEYSRIAMELALGRGGDQVVVKDGEKIFYYGGKSQAVEKNTRVKARVKAHALKEFMVTKDKVLVMGHKITDVDSFGAAVGVYRAARTLEKQVHIVINDPTSSIRILMKGFLGNPDYPEDMFVGSQRAKEIVDENTMVVVVDTNRPSYTECEDLLYMTKTIVVLDHHRQSSEVIRGSILSYIEPYASSACEMVAEILQYFTDGIRIRNIEADSIYAGIMIDTNNFMQKTGVRTFEAAAFLRRCGADVSRVRKIFRERIEDYRAKGEAISNAKLYQKVYAITECPVDENMENPTVIGAQAANELLNVIGVKASFVLTKYHNTIYISARSIDEVNVQLIMERMGGGGHLNVAGCQIANVSVAQADESLKKTLDEMIRGGEI